MDYPHRSLVLQSALTEFREKLPHFILAPEKDPEDASSKPSFVRVRQLRKWLSETTYENGNLVKNIERLLQEAFASYYGTRTYAPYKEGQILSICPLVFCMLLEVDKGHLIDQVMRQRIIDEDLHKFNDRDLYNWTHDELSYPDVRDHEPLFKVFSQRRWTYVPHKFEFGRDVELPRSCVLPIYKKQQINNVKSVNGTIYRLCIPEDHLDDKMRRHLEGSSFVEPTAGTCYHLAVKTFTEDTQPNDWARLLFEKERDAYRHLEDQSGMVRYLGAYTHRNVENQAEHNILLEYGEYDLAEYFRFPPPVLSENVCVFWHNLFSVARALSKLHKFMVKRRGQEEAYWGWHADIKPDNILSVKGVLKLADPGFAGFARIVEGEQAPRTTVVAMTTTYGAPECVSRETEWPQAADMWSLGCVFSEAATWLILGPAGLAQYTKLRQDAIHRINTSRMRRISTLEESAYQDFGEGDYFHDGRSVLVEVSQWHKYLKKHLRKSDSIAEEVLNIIDRGLLVSNPQFRLDAEKLCNELEAVKANHPILSDLDLPQSIVEAVKDVEAQLKTQPSASIWNQDLTIQSRKALKTKGLLELSREDVARISDTLKERLHSVISRPQLTITTVPRLHQIGSHPVIQSPLELSPIDAPSRSNGHLREQSQSSVINRVRLAGDHSRHKPQSVFDAHYAKASEGKRKSETKKGFGKSLFTKLKGNKPKDKDELLAMHYSDRDIKFIVDNSASIIPEWAKVRFVLEKMATKAAYIDSDGMEIEFTNGDQVINIHEQNLSREVEGAMARFRPRPDTETNMARKLGDLLYKWLQTFKENPRLVRSITLIVLTDGCWRGMSKAQDVEDQIVEFNEQFKSIPGTGLLQRYVTIQFVSFGEDPGALYRLRHLDNDLVMDRGIDDIIDTEPWQGDIYKMLLGSLVPNIDSLDEEADHTDPGSALAPPEQSFDYQSSNRRERTSSHHAQSSYQGVPRSDYQVPQRNSMRTSASLNSQQEYMRQQRSYQDATDHYRYPT